MKKLATISFALLLVSACSVTGIGNSSNVSQDTLSASNKKTEVRIAAASEFKELQDNASLKSDDKVYVADFGVNKGGQFLTKVNFNTFSVKAPAANPNVNGIPAKTPADVATVDVYLLKLPSNFNPLITTDPFSTANVNVFYSKTGLAKTGASINLLFTGLPGNVPTTHYWVGVIAKDAGNNVISKSGAAWTATTATYPGLNISSTGIGVDATTLAVSNTTELSLSVSLLDAIGAQLNSRVDVTAGTSVLPAVSAAPYALP